MKSRLPQRAGPLKAQGSALLEALIAILIFSLGILGIIGLQATMLSASTEAKMRTDAAAIASAEISHLWTYKAEIAAENNATCATDASILPSGVCKVSVADVAIDAADKTTDKAFTVTVKVTWRPPKAEEDSNYTVVSNIVWGKKAA